MNKKIIIVAVVALAAIAAFLYTKRSSQLESVPTNQSLSQVTSEATEFAKAIESGRPTTCTLTNAEAQMEYKIKGKMMRVTTTDIKAAPSVNKGHMINDTKFLYIWADGQKQGTKTPIPTEEEVKNLQDQAQKYQDNTPSFSTEEDYNSLKDQGYTINCQPGSVTDADFVPPQDITFTDLSAMMQAVPSPAADGSIDYKKLQEQYGSMMPQE